MIGIVGPKAFARDVRVQINQFIKGNLHLEVRKDELVVQGSKPIKFLGYLIYLAAFSEKTRPN